MDSEEFDCARFIAKVAPYLFFPEEENNLNPDHDDQKSQDLDAPEPSAVVGSSNMVPPVPQDDDMIMSSSQTEGIRHAAADRRFLEDLGLTPQTFMALLDGTGIEWDDDDGDDDDEEEEEEDEGEEDEDEDEGEEDEDQD
jgi:ribonuclease E